MPESNFIFTGAAALTSVYLLLFGFYIFDLAEIIYLDIDRDILSGIGWIFVLSYIFLPLPILNFRGRLYFFKIFALMVASPIIGLNFKIHYFT